MSTLEGAPPRGEPVAPVLAFGLACAAWSFAYDPLRLPPRPPGTVGLVLAGDVLPMLVAPLLFARLALRRPLRDFGWRWPGGAPALGAAAAGWLALLPAVVVLAGTPAFQAAYPSPQFPPAREHGVGLALHALLHHVPQLLAVEALMRGFLFQPLARARGPAWAVAVTGLPYVALHATKPPLELALAAWGAVVLGVLAWRTRSWLPAFAAHWAVAVSMDVLCLYRGAA